MPKTLTRIDNPGNDSHVIHNNPQVPGASAYVQTRILLALWTMGEVTRSELKSGLIRKRDKETATVYAQRIERFQKLVAQLEEEGAIAVKNNKLTLSATGLQLLDQGLTHPDFAFDAQIGAKTANALLKWMHYKLAAVSISTISGKAVAEKSEGSAIASYEAFKTVAAEVFDRLNRDFNLDNLVPIYRIRREMSDRVSRGQFDEWLLEMQANDEWQLIGGEMPDITPDKAEDSIKTALGGIRYYAKQL